MKLLDRDRDRDKYRTRIKDIPHIDNQDDLHVRTNVLGMEGKSKRENSLPSTESVDSVIDESQNGRISGDDYSLQDRRAINSKREKRKSCPAYGSSLGLDAGNLRMMRDSSSGSGTFFCNKESTLLTGTTSTPYNNNSPSGRKAGSMQALYSASQCPKGLLSSVCCLDLRKAIAAGNLLHRAVEKVEQNIPRNNSPSSSHIASKSQKLKSGALLKLNARARQQTALIASGSAGRGSSREIDSGKGERVLRGRKSTGRIDSVEVSDVSLSGDLLKSEREY